MRKKERIKVVVGRFGREPEEIEVAQDSTVQVVLNEANISLGSSEKVWVNSEKAALGDIVDDGDVINIVSPKQAGL